MNEQARWEHGVGPRPSTLSPDPDRSRCARPGHQDHPMPCQACRTEREGGDGGTALRAMMAAVRAGGDR